VYLSVCVMLWFFPLVVVISQHEIFSLRRAAAYGSASLNRTATGVRVQLAVGSSVDEGPFRCDRQPRPTGGKYDHSSESRNRMYTIPVDRKYQVSRDSSP
jgi:hypothetical protein